MDRVTPSQHEPFWRLRVEGRRAVEVPAGGFGSTMLLVKWLKDQQLRKRLDEATYQAAMSCGQGPRWRQALDLLSEMQRQQLQARAAFCTAALSACAGEPLRAPPRTAAARLLRAMLRWSMRPYDGTYAALAGLEAWPEALDRLTRARAAGVNRLPRTRGAAADAAASGADWRLPLAVLSDAADTAGAPAPAAFRWVGAGARVAAWARGWHWHVALQNYEASLEHLPDRERVCKQLIRGCSHKEQGWSEVLKMLDAMYDAELRPDGEVYEACAFACAAAKEWAWAVQLYEELLFNNLRASPSLEALALDAQARLTGDASQPSALMESKGLG
ncbi:unnamed protein product [Effrenium voratum]|nr:unnamed protein product [Effrenium voratum]CAJ1462067.1 unnamed protein product [Effrenium voratum]